MSKQIEKIKELIAKREQARLGGGEKAIEKQHARGKYTARERIDMLVDEGSFEEYDMFKLHRCHNFGMEKKQYLGDGVVAGSATVDGRLVYVYAQDFTVNGGSLSETMSQKICKIMDMAMTMGAPVICMNDSGGARIQEGINALAGYGEIFERNILASGVIPQISGIFGPCAGGAVYSPALTDFTLMMENTSYMFLTGPKVVKSVTGEDVDSENLGGASVHATKSGVTHFTAKTEEEAMDMIKKLLSYIPSNNTEEAPRVACDDPINRMDDSLNDILPDDPNKAYDMYKVITAITDNGEFFEVQPKFAKNIITGFARFNGQSVGIVANQRKVVKTKKGEMQVGGVIYSDSADKATRFIANCNQKRIPLVFLQDVTGFMVGSKSEHGGIIKDGAKLVNAVANSVVPKFTIIVGNSYGAGNYAMCGKAYDPRLIVAYPSANLAVMGGAQAAKVLLQIETATLKRKGETLSEERERELLENIQEKYNQQTTPYYAAARLWTDAIIDPLDTRLWISQGIEAANGAPIEKPFNLGVIQV